MSVTEMDVTEEAEVGRVTENAAKKNRFSREITDELRTSIETLLMLKNAVGDHVFKIISDLNTLRVIEALRENEFLRTNEISKITGLRRYDVYVIMQKLERLGLIVKYKMNLGMKGGVFNLYSLHENGSSVKFQNKSP